MALNPAIQIILRHRIRERRSGLDLVHKLIILQKQKCLRAAKFQLHQRLIQRRTHFLGRFNGQGRRPITHHLLAAEYGEVQRTMQPADAENIAVVAT